MAGILQVDNWVVWERARCQHSQFHDSGLDPRPSKGRNNGITARKKILPSGVADGTNIRKRVSCFLQKQIRSTLTRWCGLVLQGMRSILGIETLTLTSSVTCGASQTEELNYHKIALRYSDCLSKDVAFTGLRAIFRRIGKVPPSSIGCG